MPAIEKIEVHLDGIGHVLADRMLAVPVHQRAYAWTSEQVDDLFKDVSDAIRQNSEEYFLGTLVLTQGESDRQMVIDGQQRLATTCILIGAIRDYFELQGDTERANEIKKKYLSERTIRTLTETPHLVLDEVDNEFFISNVLTSINDPRRKAEPKVPSHERIA